MTVKIQDINQRYFIPIRDKAVTAIITTNIKENVKPKDRIELLFNGFDSYSLFARVTFVERLRLDELKTRHIVACGYAHKDLLEDNIIRDLGIDIEDGGLIYYIEFEKADDTNIEEAIRKEFYNSLPKESKVIRDPLIFKTM